MIAGDAIQNVNLRFYHFVHLEFECFKNHWNYRIHNTIRTFEEFSNMREISAPVINLKET